MKEGMQELEETQTTLRLFRAELASNEEEYLTYVLDSGYRHGTRSARVNFLELRNEYVKKTITKLEEKEKSLIVTTEWNKATGFGR